MTTSSELRHRVTIQAHPVNTDGPPARDVYGQAVLDWSDVATVWAKVEPTTGQEPLAGGAVVAEQSYTVTMRCRSWITPKHRLVYAGRLLEIKSVQDVGELHFWTEIMAVGGMSQG